MDIKFNVKRKYVVNGKEYGSLKEMPAAIREAYEKAVGKTHVTEHGNIPTISSQKIVFNGQEYENVHAMPPDIRPMYETVMKTVNEGKISLTGNVDFKFGKKAPDPRKGNTLDAYNIATPIEPKSGLSPRILILAGALIVFIIGLYILISLGGSR